MIPFKYGYVCLIGSLLGVGMVAGGGACKTNVRSDVRSDIPPLMSVPAAHLAFPKLAGWVPDPHFQPAQPQSGGAILRLVRQSAVVGSPRIEVVLEKPQDRPSVIEDFLTQNLREMARLESSGQIRILHVEQQKIRVGSLPAYRVHHEYTLGHGSSQVAINQVSTFLVIEGRGVAVTAVGRTELFHPVADSIDTLMKELTVQSHAAQGSAVDKGLPTDVEPIDLGSIGGGPQ